MREQKQAAVNAKKKRETDCKDIKSAREINNKLKEGALKQLKKLQQAMKEIQMERDRKTQTSIEQLTTKLASEQDNVHKRENIKMGLEKQDKEPKVEKTEEKGKAERLWILLSNGLSKNYIIMGRSELRGYTAEAEAGRAADSAGGDGGRSAADQGPERVD